MLPSGINPAVVAKDKAVLLLIKGHFAFVDAPLSSLRVNVEQSIDYLSIEDGLRDYLGNIFCLYLWVEDALRIDDNQRPHLTEAVTVGHLQFYGSFQMPILNFGPKCADNFLATGGMASRSTTHGYAELIGVSFLNY
jgi:hypothetical protein